MYSVRYTNILVLATPERQRGNQLVSPWAAARVPKAYKRRTVDPASHASPKSNPRATTPSQGLLVVYTRRVDRSLFSPDEATATRLPNEPKMQDAASSSIIPEEDHHQLIHDRKHQMRTVGAPCQPGGSFACSSGLTYFNLGLLRVANRRRLAT